MDLTRNSQNKARTVIIICTVIVLLTAVFSLCLGQYSLPLKKIFSIVAGNGSKVENNVFFKIRLPRTIMAIMAGAGLGLAGAVYQSVFKNPLASPDVIGISSGANLGSAVMIVLFGNSLAQVASGAFLGGLLAVVCVIGLVNATKSNSTSTYVLSGIIISAVASALIMLLKYYADNEGDLAAIEYWTMGSLSAITQSKVVSVLPFWFVGFVFTLLLSRQVELLNLNEDEARALGVKVKQIRILVLICSTLLVSSVICLTGLISFAGLISPHIVALILNRRDRKFLILSSIVGGEVLLISDILCRTLSTAELPLSVLTTVIGVPILVVVMIQRKRKNG